ncbi:GntR family transcriptional regulator [Streptomyces sp. NPDC057743]|uniref:GntR family transcriptional regulator n=1 Tax=Streptomyces sp. NPDC057743 TaxID=3346236 RepID=UPI0036CD745D
MPQASPRDTYLEVSGSLRQKIEKGKIAEKLPSQAKLMEIYDVSRSTIERALGDLKSKGVIESVQGAGWYVAGTGDRRPLVEKMTDLLRTDGVKVGDRFPTEKELCDQFKVSRTAVRSAIAQMEGQGLIGRGATRGREVCALPVGQGDQGK